MGHTAQIYIQQPRKPAPHYSKPLARRHARVTAIIAGAFFTQANVAQRGNATISSPGSPLLLAVAVFVVAVLISLSLARLSFGLEASGFLMWTGMEIAKTLRLS